MTTQLNANIASRVPWASNTFKLVKKVFDDDALYSVAAAGLLSHISHISFVIWSTLFALMILNQVRVPTQFHKLHLCAPRPKAY